MNKHSPKKKQEWSKLLGISEEQFGKYERIFCSTRVIDKYGILNGNGWCTVQHPWNQQLLLKHLAGDTILALVPADHIDYLMFDIDNHNPGETPSVESRCRDIISIFRAEPLIYTSSNSLGARVCYFLDQVCQRRTILAFGKNSLTSNDLQIESGLIEIRANMQIDRLPFGNGSYLINASSFRVLNQMSLADRIERASEIYSGQRLTIVDNAENNHPKQLHKSNEFNNLIADLIENGLSPDINTTVALMKFSYELQGRRGFTRDRAAQFMKSWISQHHNGLSRRVNAGRESDIFDQIDRIVAGHDPSKVRFRGTNLQLDKQLALGDVRCICNIFSGYRDQLAAFSLLHYVKNQGSLEEEVGSELREEGKKQLVTNVAGFQQIWTCEIPSKAFRRFDGFDKTNPAITRRRFEEIGLIELWKPHSQAQHKCCTYKVFFSFDTDSRGIVSLDEALNGLKSREELKSEYGRHRSEKLINERSTA